MGGARQHRRAVNVKMASHSVSCPRRIGLDLIQILKK